MLRVINGQNKDTGTLLNRVVKQIKSTNETISVFTELTGMENNNKRIISSTLYGTCFNI